MAENANFEVRQRVGYITIDRPSVRNALDMETRVEIINKLKKYASRDDLGAVVIESVGDEVFSSGGDMSEVDESGFEIQGYLNNTEIWEELFWTLIYNPKPIIAKIDGLTLAGATNLLLFVDIVVASDEAKFALPEIDLGMYEWISTTRMPYYIGPRKTLFYCMTGEPMTAEDANQIGFVSEVVPNDELDDRVEYLAQELAGKDSETLEKIKKSVYLSLDMNPTSAFYHMKVDETMKMQREGDVTFKEGMQDFLNN